MFAPIAAILRKIGRKILILFGSKFTNEPFSQGLRQHDTSAQWLGAAGSHRRTDALALGAIKHELTAESLDGPRAIAYSVNSRE
jgi:hypothetical protein